MTHRGPFERDKTSARLRSPMRATLATAALLLLPATSVVGAPAAEHAAAEPALSMSADLRDLIRTEMRELLNGAQSIAVALPAADWKGIATTSARMRDSYVLEQKLTDAQREEVERLPDRFKALDEGFHQRADNLARSATAEDAKAVAHEFGRLLEACTTCHAAFARAIFPGFRAESERHGVGHSGHG
jgi:cytochrome c556